jgi:DNA-binding MarR family transcriptional regulator
VLVQLTLLNRHIAGRLDLRDVDHACLNLVERHGALSPRDLARRANLHPATMTGVLDRLERGHWVVRERDPSDRRGVLVRPLHLRHGEMMRLYAPMFTSLNRICAEYKETELERIADFLRLAASAGRDASDELARSEEVLEVR